MVVFYSFENVGSRNFCKDCPLVNGWIMRKDVKCEGSLCKICVKCLKFEDEFIQCFMNKLNKIINDKLSLVIFIYQIFYSNQSLI